MDQFDGYKQVLTVPSSAVDALNQEPAAKDLARLANDGMAELVVKYPERFVGFAASLPFLGTDDALEELERCVGELGALGVEFCTSVNGTPMDDPRFEPFYARMAALDKPIWAHPSRPAAMADYPTESHSKHRLSTTFGWPYETAVFMSRLIFSGVMDRYPNLRIITHHAGGMVPHHAARIVAQSRMRGPEGHPVADILKRDILDYYRMFYGDTALQGVAKHALECAISFFGVEHILFGTDMPFGDDDGLAYIRDNITTVDALSLTTAERQKIFEDNARRLLGLSGRTA
ncbi:MAG: amidohydrolase [Deltaproteobacteria bacterium]|nr:amidohydrolase [Deltaproteobacteria bacterium]